MDAETINALGQLWKPILALAFLITIFLFRGPISGFISRLTSIKFGDKELQANDKVEQNEENATVSQQVQKESTTDVDDSSVEEPPTTGDAFIKMIVAFKLSNFKMAEQAYEEQLAAEQSEDERRKIEADYLYRRYTNASDSTALAKLRELASHRSTKARVLYSLARCYWSTKDYSKAREIYAEARDVADEVYAAQLTGHIAECWEKEGNPDQGLEEVITKLQEVEKADAKVHLYKSMASMYQAEGSERMRAIALEKALEFAPHDTDIRFNAAYAQSKANLSAISITNYDILLTFKPKNAISLNNLGVECRNVTLPFKSVDYYKKAAREDNTLAISNLAYLFINTGFYDEAAAELSRASQLSNPHENVASAKAELQKRRREEQDKWTNLIEIGTRQQQFLREFAQASVEATTKNPFLGTWQLPSGETCSVENDGIRICLEFKYEEKRCRLEAGIRNCSAEGKLLLWKQEWYQQEGSFQEGSDALATISSGGTTLSILELSDSPTVLRTVLRMTRISNST